MEKKDFKFDKRVDKYDDHFEGRMSRRFYELLYRYTDLKKGDRVLDVGCGTGTILKTFSELENIEGHGIDVEPQMLSVAHRKCPDMDIRECSCEDTPYDDSYFDTLTVCMAYHHFPDKDAFTKEALRLLKPNGRLYIADPAFPHPVRKALNLMCRNINGEFFSSEEMRSRFEKQGFRYIGVQKDRYAQLVIFEKNADALKGKRLIPFSTHEGSGLSGFDKKLASVCPGSMLLKGLAIRGNDCQNKQEDVKNKVNEWVSGLGY